MALTVSLIVSFSWALLIISGYFFLRLLVINHHQLWFRTVLVTVVSIIVAGCFVKNCREKTPNRPQEVDGQFLLLPDEARIDGDLASATVRDMATHRQYKLNWRLKSQQQQYHWQRLRNLAVISVSGQEQAVVPATNDSQFDARQYYYSQRIYSEIRAQEVQVCKRLSPVSPLDYCHLWRCQAHQYFKRLPSPLREYADQLLIGYRGSTADWQQAIKQLGIIHLFCLSGMHVVLLVEIIRRCLTYCRMTREMIDIILAVSLPGYLILGGGSASLLRAVLMAECRLLPRRFNLRSIDAWSWSLIIGCWFDPFVLTSLGGQLSYLLSLLLQMIEQGEFAQSLLLNLAGLPLIIHSVFEIHLLTFVMSYLISPIFGILIFPGTIITTVLYRFWNLPAVVFNDLLNVFHQFLLNCARLPGMICFGRPPEWAVWLLLVLSLLIIDQPLNYRPYVRLVLVYLGVFFLIHCPFYGEVVFVDVGQGDSIIIKTPFNRHIVMVDTGGKLAFQRPNWAKTGKHYYAAEKTSINYLKSRGVNRIDAVFLSHSDADHIGDLPAVLTTLHVKRIYVPAGMEKMQKFRKRLPVGTEVAVFPAQTGDVCEHLLQAVHPNNRGKGANGDSLTLLGMFGGRQFLFTGDLDQHGEQEVIDKYPQLRIDVLKLGHHGSRTASGERFLKTIRPQIGIVSAGRFNRYGHPHNVTMHRLATLGIQTLSTQQYGMIKYQYVGKIGRWTTTLRGDELRWMLPPYSNS